MAAQRGLSHRRNIRIGNLSKQRPRGVTVSTLDSESSDRGSNPREAFPAALKCVPRFGMVAPCGQIINIVAIACILFINAIAVHFHVVTNLDNMKQHWL